MQPDITLYTMSHCPYCRRAKALLKAKGVTAWTEIDIEADPSRRPEMNAASGRNTVPQIFIGATHIGGASDLFDLDDKGGLDPLLAGTP